MVQTNRQDDDTRAVGRVIRFFGDLHWYLLLSLSLSFSLFLSLFCLSSVSLLSLFCLSSVSLLSLFCLSSVSLLSLFCLSSVSLLSLFCLSSVSLLSLLSLSLFSLYSLSLSLLSLSLSSLSLSLLSLISHLSSLISHLSSLISLLSLSLCLALSLSLSLSLSRAPFLCAGIHAEITVDSSQFKLSQCIFGPQFHIGGSVIQVFCLFPYWWADDLPRFHGLRIPPSLWISLKMGHTPHRLVDHHFPLQLALLFGVQWNPWIRSN